MTSKPRNKLWLGGVLLIAPLGLAQADAGLYVGGSIGTAAIEIDMFEGIGTPLFDEDDFAWKAYGGYNFGVLPIVDLSIEGGYVDFGKPTTELEGTRFSLDASGWNVFGVVGVDLGPLGLFGKVGYLAWDAEGVIDSFSASDDGFDLGYGVGARINLGNLEIRGEYELYDIEDTEDVSMWSAGLVWHFD